MSDEIIRGELRPQKNHADADPKIGRGCLISEGKQGDSDVLRPNSCMTIPEHIAAEPQFRITEDDIFRITENGHFRILETAA